MNRIDWKKPIRSSDGRDARVLGPINGFKTGEPKPVEGMAVAIKDAAGFEAVMLVDDYGFPMNPYGVGASFRIENGPGPRHKVWVSIWKTPSGYGSTVFNNEESARLLVSRGRVGLFCLDFEEGEGLQQ